MPPDGTNTGLYERDFYAWTIQQAEAIRAARAARLANSDDLDWDNLAEEIEALGRNNRRELLSRMTTVIEHLLKLEHSPSAEPRAGWVETVARSRIEIALLLDDSPSLRTAIPELLPRASVSALRIVSGAFGSYGETGAVGVVRRRETIYTADQILDDWWPETAS